MKRATLYSEDAIRYLLMAIGHDPKKGWTALTNVPDWPSPLHEDIHSLDINMPIVANPEAITQAMIDAGIVALKGSWNMSRPDAVRSIYLAMRAAR